MNKKLRTPIAAILLIIITAIRLFQLSDICAELFYYKLNLNFLTILSLVIDLALCFALFTKKRNNILVIVLGCSALLEFIYLASYFSILNLLSFAAYALLFIFSLALCEQTLVKADLSKIKEFANKLFFLPAVIPLALTLYNWIRVMGIPDSFMPPLNTVIAILQFIVLLSVAMWLKDPYAKSQKVSEVTNDSTYVEEEYSEAYCGLGKHIVLCLFTFGIWYLIWTYRTTKYLNKAPNAVQYNPTSKLLLCMFVPFYQIYWFYKHGQRLDAMSKQKKLNNSDMATLCLILGIFIPIVACILMQDRINILCTTKTVVEETKAEDSTTEQLKKYKELLDSGVISEEEFDAKKKQLLGL